MIMPHIRDDLGICLVCSDCCDSDCCDQGDCIQDLGERAYALGIEYPCLTEPRTGV